MSNHISGDIDEGEQQQQGHQQQEVATPIPHSANNSTSGKHLRWTRITKIVDLKKDGKNGGGLVRGSIAATATTAERVGTNGASPIDQQPQTTIQDLDENNIPSSSVSSSRNTILNGVSGSASPGQVLAIMGPSGSGKTSILDILSGRSTYNSGTITIDGEVVTDRIMKKMKKKVAYVKQSDLFFGHLTVRDQLTYTAFLRLPSIWSKNKKVLEVNRIIKLLRLSKCADTPIERISGGEKKRVNIGSELLTDPSILMLDEPTSGLDSTSAVALLHTLDSLARREGKTIITSIHQPSSAVFFAFDKLMLLAEGNVVYFGTPRGSLDYVKQLGLECPPGYNAADHHMDLLVVDGALEDDEEEEVDYNDSHCDVENVDDDFMVNGEVVVSSTTGLRQRKRCGTRRQSTGVATTTTTRQKLIESWDAETSAGQIEEEGAKDFAKFGMSDGSSRHSQLHFLSRRQSSVMAEKSFNTTWWTQYTVLVHRSMKNSRSAIFTKLNLIKSGAIGLMVGLLWYQMPYTESTVYDRSSYFFFTMTFWVRFFVLLLVCLLGSFCINVEDDVVGTYLLILFLSQVFDAMFTAYMTFPLERAIIFKERSSGAYHLSAYFTAKTTSEAPARLLLPAIYMVISYWMSGVNNNFWIFVATTTCSLLSVLAGESIGLFLGAAVLDLEKGMVIMTVAALTLMVVGGFFVRIIPPWLLWLGYLSPFKYSYNSSVQLVFNQPVPCDGSKVLSACHGGSVGYASEANVLEFLGVQLSAGLNAALLFCIFVVIRFLAFFALKSKKAEERT